jgi:uncharacterized protein DUF1592/uncharacterized protein DUF1588/uncharacterized protein DUF1587/uncharacterized protein DUF1585/uncharacterized protein DUF1595/cytochrome c
MESRSHIQNHKRVSGRTVAALMIGTVMAFLLIVQKIGTPAKNTGALTEKQTIDQFHKIVSPILQKRCYDCHGDGAHKASIAFDTLTTSDQIRNPQLWLKVLRNTRSHIMPPPSKGQPTLAEQQELEQWIKTGGFGLDPSQPDPGRVTIHRLNRVEYKNTIRDLMGVDFETKEAFPDDDSGYGFDNIADVLNMSPLLMEKYLTAAQTVVGKAVPVVTRVPALQIAGVEDFKYPDGTPTAGKIIRGSGLGADGTLAIALPYPKESSVSHVFDVKQAGDYRVVLEQNFRGDFSFNPQRAVVTVAVDGKQVSEKEHGWESNHDVDDVYTVHWEPGLHTISTAIKPAATLGKGTAGRGADNLYNIKKVRLEGPLDPAQWVHPANYTRFFGRDVVPSDEAGRRDYAKEILNVFASKAYRRPAPAESIDQLAEIAEKVYSVPGTSFESGVAQAMVAVLASPRFLFRVDRPAPTDASAAYANVDDYSLASRLSYFLWSTMPDDELLQLAGAGTLRANLSAQVKRMLADPRSSAFVENFTGHWLQTRLVTTVPLNPREIMAREGVSVGGGARGFGRGGGGGSVSDTLRNASEQEAEKYFEYVLREDRSVDEFLASDYTFLNETLATAYKISDVKGPELRKVVLPPGDARGGILTMGSVLMVTSNPTRTSPVKRGKWILENILAAPTPPPPPNVPALEDSKPKDDSHVPTLRETLAVHREDAMCASCHNRMDPLGLALENFNALGQWRAEEYKQKIDPSGQLATGETFTGIAELKRILVARHKVEFYRCLTEKMLTYALGRGMEYYDVPTVDKIVESLDRNHGAFSALLTGVIESAPFQQQRLLTNPIADATNSAPSLTQNTP